MSVGPVDKQRNENHLVHWEPNFLSSSIFQPFDSLRDTINKFSEWPSVDDLECLKQIVNRSVHTRSGKPLRFVPQSMPSNEFSQQYEPRIFQTGEVQTRKNNWHDFFNALVWITFPQAKAALNQIHFNALQCALKDGQKQRGPLRDAATLFDESGVVVVCSDKALTDLLRNHEWKKLFWEQREAVLSSMRFFVFGHGLYEKALNPYLGMTGKSIIFDVEQSLLNLPLLEQIKTLDERLVPFLLQEKFTSADLVPIPILGYPSWLPDNNCEVFYENKQYFRPHPSRRKG